MMESAAHSLGFSSVTPFMWFLAIIGGAAYIFAPVATKALWGWVTERIKTAVKDAAGINLSNLKDIGSPATQATPDAALPARIAEFDSIPGIDAAAKWEYLKSGQTLQQALIAELTKRPATPAK